MPIDRKNLHHQFFVWYGELIKYKIVQVHQVQ